MFGAGLSLVTSAATASPGLLTIVDVRTVSVMKDLRLSLVLHLFPLPHLLLLPLLLLPPPLPPLHLVPQLSEADAKVRQSRTSTVACCSEQGATASWNSETDAIGLYVSAN